MRTTRGSISRQGGAKPGRCPLQGLDLDLAVGAAFCLRYREVLAETRAGDEISAGSTRPGPGATAGWTWRDPALVSRCRFPPWRSIEMQLSDGTGIHAWVEESLDDTGDGFEYGVEVAEARSTVRTGGSERSGRQPTGRPFTDHRLWQQAIDSLKAR